MAKINLSCYIENANEKNVINTLGIYSQEDDIIKWSESKTSYFLNLQKNEFVKEDESTRLILLWNEKKETIGSYYLKELDRTVNLEIKTKQIKKTENEFVVNYYIKGDNDNIIHLKLSWEVANERKDSASY